ncbi:MAG: hypothetical protein WDM89_18485 [Rhizomicrobium sp.]
MLVNLLRYLHRGKVIQYAPQLEAPASEVGEALTYLGRMGEAAKQFAMARSL